MPITADELRNIMNTSDKNLVEHWKSNNLNDIYKKVSEAAYDKKKNIV